MAIDGTYKVVGTLGKHSESVVIDISTDGSTVWLSADAPVVGSVATTGEVTGSDSFTASGTLRVLFKRITYRVAARIKGDTLIAVCDTNVGTVEVVGSRIS